MKAKHRRVCCFSLFLCVHRRAERRRICAANIQAWARRTLLMGLAHRVLARARVSLARKRAEELALRRRLAALRIRRYVLQACTQQIAGQTSSVPRAELEPRA